MNISILQAPSTKHSSSLLLSSRLTQHLHPTSNIHHVLLHRFRCNVEKFQAFEHESQRIVVPVSYSRQLETLSVSEHIRTGTGRGGGSGTRTRTRILVLVLVLLNCYSHDGVSWLWLSSSTVYCNRLT